jgi:hypothetical protein
MKSFSDYPKKVKQNAMSAIKRNKKLGNRCGTQVGKVRAQQLAQGKPISLQTVKRMKSYLSRAKTYDNKSNPMACGSVSYDLWGGDEALRWANKKIEKHKK